MSSAVDSEIFLANGFAGGGAVGTPVSSSFDVLLPRCEPCRPVTGLGSLYSLRNDLQQTN